MGRQIKFSREPFASIHLRFLRLSASAARIPFATILFVPTRPEAASGQSAAYGRLSHDYRQQPFPLLNQREVRKRRFGEARQVCRKSSPAIIGDACCRGWLSDSFHALD